MFQLKCLKGMGQTIFLTLSIGWIVGCGSPFYDSTLPNSEQLGTIRGLRTARVITHDHSPFSYDACDKQGFSSDGKINSTCLNHFRTSLCKNHIDLVFLSDHPDNMAKYEITDLLLQQSEDVLLTSNGAPYANVVSGCSDGFKPLLMTGFEGRLLGLGLTSHIDPDANKRISLYAEETLDLRSRIASQANGLVIVPHTESRSVSLIRSLQPDGIEIYNIHANLDPKIRMNFLNVPPFKHIAGVMTYLIDPYKNLNPDFSFLGFFEIFPTYIEKWNELIGSQVKVTGVAGTDAHENIFPQIVADGERFDSHRRLTRFISNHVFVKTIDVDSIKNAIKLGRSYVVVEGLGTPQDFDFSAANSLTAVGVGDSIRVNDSSVTLSVKMPQIWSGSPQGSKKPEIRIELRKVLTEGKDQVIANSTQGDISFSTRTPGAYRAQVYLKPHHLKSFLGPLDAQTESEFPWIITNHIYLTQ